MCSSLKRIIDKFSAMSVEDNLKPSIAIISPSDVEVEVKKIEEELHAHQQLEGEKIKSILDDVKKLWDFISWLRIAEAQGVWKAKTCRHSINDRCQAWNISDPDRVGLPPDVVQVNQDGTKNVWVGKYPHFCIACPLYEAKRS